MAQYLLPSLKTVCMPLDGSANESAIPQQQNRSQLGHQSFGRPVRCTNSHSSVAQ